jgi:hypothetical protein
MTSWAISSAMRSSGLFQPGQLVSTFHSDHCARVNVLVALTASKPYFPFALLCCSVASRLGATMALSLASDALSLATFHLYLFYLGMTSIYRWHLSVLFSLFNVFRGQKYNVIRRRTEPSSYGLDQQLAGTILFTLATFLFPTVLAYYLFFALVSFP